MFAEPKRPLGKLCSAVLLLGQLLSVQLIGNAEETAQPPALTSATQDAIDSVGFDHSVTVNAMPYLPALLSFVPKDLSLVRDVRALLVIDEELLVVPMHLEPSQRRFQASFPTPLRSLNYRFQITLDSGKAILSESLRADPRCADRNYQPDGINQPETRTALQLQLREQQLRYALEVLDRIDQGDFP